jgi:hypothetical protein
MREQVAMGMAAGFAVRRALAHERSWHAGLHAHAEELATRTRHQLVGPRRSGASGAGLHICGQMLGGLEARPPACLVAKFAPPRTSSVAQLGCAQPLARSSARSQPRRSTAIADAGRCGSNVVPTAQLRVISSRLSQYPTASPAR